MIMDKKNNNFRYVAGACFVIEALRIIINHIVAGYTSFDPWTLVLIVGYALIAASMFASVDILTSVGGGFLAADAINTLITITKILLYLLDYFRDDFLIYSLQVTSLFIRSVVCILFVVIGLNRKNAKTISIVAAALLVVQFLLTTLYNNIPSRYNNIHSSSFHLNFTDILFNTILIIGTIMIGLVLNIDDVKTSSGKTASSNNINLTTPAENQIDRLAKLKDLLDNGVISQEEFDAKKKQILGQ